MAPETMENEDRPALRRTAIVLWLVLGVAPLLATWLGFVPGLACVGYYGFIGGMAAIAVYWGPRRRRMGFLLAITTWVALGIGPMLYCWYRAARGGDAFGPAVLAFPGLVGGAIAVAVLWRPRAVWLAVALPIVAMVACRAGMVVTGRMGVHRVEAFCDEYLDRLRTDPEWARRHTRPEAWKEIEASWSEMPEEADASLLDIFFGSWEMKIHHSGLEGVGYMTVHLDGDDLQVDSLDWYWGEYRNRRPTAPPPPPDDAGSGTSGGR